MSNLDKVLSDVSLADVFDNKFAFLGEKKGNWIVFSFDEDDVGLFLEACNNMGLSPIGNRGEYKCSPPSEDMIPIIEGFYVIWLGETCLGGRVGFTFGMIFAKESFLLSISFFGMIFAKKTIIYFWHDICKAYAVIFLR